MERVRWTKLRLQVKELRELGLCSVEIAEKLGKAPGNITKIASQIGMPFTEEERQRSHEIGIIKYSSKLRRENEVDKLLRKHGQDFEYVGGYVNCDKHVDVRCLWCGNTMSKSMVSIRKGFRLSCDYCDQGKAWNNLQDDVKRISDEFRRARRQETGKIPKIAIHRTLKYCKECGRPFYQTYPNDVYCSDGCRKRAYNRNADTRLNKDNIVDKDITLKKVYARDGGVCYLCGKPCDWNDYVERDGIIVCGNDYPSIDHVVPLAKGGKHEWNNVRLAHRICNSYKADK